MQYHVIIAINPRISFRSLVTRHSQVQRNNEFQLQEMKQFIALFNSNPFNTPDQVKFVIVVINWFEWQRSASKIIKKKIYCRRA